MFKKSIVLMFFLFAMGQVQAEFKCVLPFGESLKIKVGDKFIVPVQEIYFYDKQLFLPSFSQKDNNGVFVPHENDCISLLSVGFDGRDESTIWKFKAVKTGHIQIQFSPEGMHGGFEIFMGSLEVIIQE